MEGSIRGRKRKVRKLTTTNGSCFLCLQTCEIKKEGETEEVSKPNVNLRRLLRYLQISVNSENTSKIEAHVDVEVDLCESCGKLHDKFSTLFQNFEKLQMELNFNLNEIHHRVSNSEKIPELVLSYSEVGTDRETLTLVEQLRNDIACKSISKCTPKVHLVRANLPENRLVEQETPQSDLLENIYVEDQANSPPQPDVTFSEEEHSETGHQSPTSSKTLKKQRKRSLTRKTYRDIYWKQDPETGLIHCTKCDKTCRQTYGVIIHYQRVHLQNEFKCNLCNAVFTWPGTLKAHEKICQQNLEKRKENETSGFKFVCIFCDKRFQTKFKLRSHEETVHSNNEGFFCEICKKKFKHVSTLREHTQIVHLGRRFNCRFCKKTYRAPGACRRHQRSCTGLKTPIEGQTSPSTAEDPQAPASTNVAIAHQKKEIKERADPSGTSSKIQKCKVDEDTKMFQCIYDRCDYQSRHRIMVVVHYDRAHLKKNNKCRKCQKEFSFPSNLNRHLKICGMAKIQEPPVFCELCGKLCESQEILNCHQILEHKDS